MWSQDKWALFLWSCIGKASVNDAWWGGGGGGTDCKPVRLVYSREEMPVLASLGDCAICINISNI